MFDFSYDYCDHLTYLNLLAQRMGVPLVDNTLWLPAGIGSGYIKVVQLTNGIQVLFNECTIHQAFNVRRQAGDGHGLTLRFDDIRNLQSLSVKIGEELIEDATPVYSGAYLTNNAASLQYTINEGIQDNCVNLYFNTQWFKQYAGIGQHDDFWEAALTAPVAAIYFEVLTLEYRELMEEIFELKPSHPVYMAALQNRAMLMLEKFLRGLYRKINNPAYGYGVPEDELKRMMQIEALLVSHLGVAPPPVSELAKIAMMSVTKLKTTFKKVYQHGLYEYYQKNRMLKARHLLTTKKATVKEVGIELGFKNLSNFTIAFKKEFNILPSQV
ncbi:MAG: hypothetical protein RL172_1004 [Bacteroidota bacterium]